ncbi:MAG: S8 family peptidase [Armatimonadia bacterium]
MYRVPRLSALLALCLLLALMLSGSGPSATAPVVQGSAAVASETAAGGSNAAGLLPVLIGFTKAPGAAEEGLVRGASGKIKYTYHIIPAIAARLPAQAVAALAHNPRVAYIEEDAIATASADTVPWGITRVKADLLWAGNTASGVKVAVIDTGLDYRHPDLAPNYKGGYDYVNRDTDPMDDNGHGTHCSGTVAAAVEGTNVVGAGPGIALYGVKVLNWAGSGSYSDIIAALQWCVTNGMQVASMSFGGSRGSTSLQNACAAAYNANVVLVAAAGNSGKANGRGNTVLYPAKYSSVIAVAAIDSNNVRASWSSSGAEVEIAAPGVSIVSDRLGGGLITYSGTSMACPHVAGCAALTIASGVTKAATVRNRLDATALDLGAAGRDALYGYGLVDAQRAVLQASP